MSSYELYFFKNSGRDKLTLQFDKNLGVIRIKITDCSSGDAGFSLDEMQICDFIEFLQLFLRKN